MEKNLLKKSGIVAVIIAFSALAFWFGFAKLSLGAYNEKNLTKQFLAEDSEIFKTIVIEVGSNTVAQIIAGTSSMTRTGTATYPGQPRIEYSGVTGKWSFKNSGGTETVAFGTVSASYVSAEIGSTTANYVLKTNGSSTGQLATNPTFAGEGTITASFGANGLVISPEEYSCVDGGTSPFQGQIDTKLTKVSGVNTYIGSITAGGKTGTSSFEWIDGTNITSTSVVTANGGLQLTVNASGSLSAAFSAITGSASPSQLPPISGLLGSATSAQLPTIIRLPGTTTAQVAGAYGQLYVQTDNVKSSSLSMLLNFEGTGSSATFLDESSYNRTVTASGPAEIGTNTAHYGTGSLRSYPMSDSYASMADSDDFYSGTGDFTHGFSINLNAPKSGTSSAWVAGQRADASNFTYIVWDDQKNFWFQASTGGVSKASYYTSPYNPSVGTWTTIEVDRSGTNLYIFINGVSQSLTTVTAVNTNDLGNIAAPYQVGRVGASVDMLDCNIDNAYYIKGKALHTSNYTPGEYQAVLYTQYTTRYAIPTQATTILSILSPGTVTTEPSIVAFDATHTIFGSSTSVYSPTNQSGGTTTIYTVDASNRNVLGVYYTPSEEILKVVHSPKKVNRIEEMKRLRLGEWSWQIKDVNRLDAEAGAKEKFVRVALNEQDYEIITDSNGSITVTIDKQRMESDLTTLKNDKELEWASLLEQTSLVDSEEEEMESGKERFVTPFAGDATTPAILQDNSKKTLNINSQIGFAYETIKELIDMIGSLTVRIDKAGIPE